MTHSWYFVGKNTPWFLNDKHVYPSTHKMYPSTCLKTSAKIEYSTTKTIIALYDIATFGVRL